VADNVTTTTTLANHNSHSGSRGRLTANGNAILTKSRKAIGRKSRSIDKETHNTFISDNFPRLTPADRNGVKVTSSLRDVNKASTNDVTAKRTLPRQPALTAAPSVTSSNLHHVIRTPVDVHVSTDHQNVRQQAPFSVNDQQHTYNGRGNVLNTRRNSSNGATSVEQKRYTFISAISESLDDDDMDTKCLRSSDVDNIDFDGFSSSSSDSLDFRLTSQMSNYRSPSMTSSSQQHFRSLALIDIMRQDTFSSHSFNVTEVID
jgi:hypothetical protein